MESLQAKLVLPYHELVSIATEVSYGGLERHLPQVSVIKGDHVKSKIRIMLPHKQWLQNCSLLF